MSDTPQTILHARKRKMVIRLFSIADQIIFSVGNLIFSIILARYYTEIEFASYGVGLIAALTIMGIQRNCYILKNSILVPSIFRKQTRAILGEQIIFWIVLFTIEMLITAGLLLFSENVYYQSIAISTVVCTLIYIQLEFERVAYIKHEKFMRSFWMSAFFTLLTGCLYLIVGYYVHLPFWGLMATIGGYMILKMLMLFAEIGTPHFSLGWRMLRRDIKRNLVSSIVGVGGYAGFNYFPVFILAYISAPIQTAAFGAIRGIMQPLSIIIRSLDLVDKNFFAQNTTHKESGLFNIFRQQVIFYVSFSVLLIFIIFLLGEPILRIAYGEKYAAFSYLMYGWAIVFAMVIVSLPIETVIVKLNRLNTYNHMRVISGVLGIGFSFALCPDFNAMGAILASGIGWMSSVLCGLYLIKSIFKKPVS